MAFECMAHTHVGCRRKLNEDALLCAPADGIWAVADGMGGHEAGEVASEMIISALASLGPADDLASRIGSVMATLEGVNDALIDLAQSIGEGRTIGSTIVGLIADTDDYCCFWVGDSRALRIRNGEITQITRDHSLVQDLVDAGMLEAERAEDHPNANMLTRAVGAANTLAIDHVRGSIMAGDIFVLASDGLTRLVKPDEILPLLASHSLTQAGDRMLALALARGAPDNVSFVIVKFDQA
jgi:serine/threonine protein phosphatase Stp1